MKNLKGLDSISSTDNSRKSSIISNKIDPEPIPASPIISKMPATGSARSAASTFTENSIEDDNESAKSSENIPWMERKSNSFRNRERPSIKKRHESKSRDHSSDNNLLEEASEEEDSDVERKRSSSESSHPEGNDNIIDEKNQFTMDLLYYQDTSKSKKSSPEKSPEQSPRKSENRNNSNLNITTQNTDLENISTNNSKTFNHIVINEISDPEAHNQHSHSNANETNILTSNYPSLTRTQQNTKPETSPTDKQLKHEIISTSSYHNMQDGEDSGLDKDLNSKTDDNKSNQTDELPIVYDDTNSIGSSIKKPPPTKTQQSIIDKANQIKTQKILEPPPPPKKEISESERMWISFEENLLRNKNLELKG